jgi:hypothetical protein
MGSYEPKRLRELGAELVQIAEALSPARSQERSLSPEIVRSHVAARALRARVFDQGLFADPAWDILLDLTLASMGERRISVSSACIASRCPPTTGLRHVDNLVRAGLCRRTRDEADHRRVFVELTQEGAAQMTSYLLGLDAL